MKNRLIVVITTAVLLVGFVTADALLHTGVLVGFGNLFSPVGVVMSNAGNSVASFFGNFGKISGLEKENAKLKGDLDATTAELAKLDQEKIDNTSLRADLGLKTSSNLNLVTGEITSFDPTLNSGINVRVGDTTGIKKGNMVIANGFMIGQVKSVDAGVVSVTLLTDAASAVPSKIQTKEIPGISDGQIGNGLQFDQVPQGEIVNSGDIVVTSGLGGDLPAGIALAKVSKVEKVSGSIFQKIDLTPMVDVLKIHYVMIAK